MFLNSCGLLYFYKDFEIEGVPLCGDPVLFEYTLFYENKCFQTGRVRLKGLEGRNCLDFLARVLQFPVTAAAIISFCRGVVVLNHNKHQDFLIRENINFTYFCLGVNLLSIIKLDRN